MPSASPASIYAVIVLYNQSPSCSRSVEAFASLLGSHTQLSDHFRLLLYDNSPSAQIPPKSCVYHHDPRNQGLTGAYNYALDHASEAGCPWLLLLDQDTEVTLVYLQEVLELTAKLNDDQRVGAIVPKLESGKAIKSPTLGFLDWLRRQVALRHRRTLFATKEMYGLQQEELTAFNSGSVLRVEALRNAGGFPQEFWLDLLDVAVFHALHAAGYFLFVMHSSLDHAFSMDAESFYKEASAVERHRNFLSATVLFVRTRGTPRDLWLLRLWLLGNALHLFRGARNKRFGLLSLQQALLLKG